MDGNFLGTKRATGDALVSERLNFWSERPKFAKKIQNGQNKPKEAKITQNCQK